MIKRKLTGFFVIQVLLINLCYAQIAEVKGKLLNADQNKIIYLLKGQSASSDRTKWEIVDSTYINRNVFTFKIELQIPDFYVITFNGVEYRSFIAEPNKSVTINGDAKKLYLAIVQGTYNNKVREKTTEQKIPLIEKMNSFADSAEFAMNHNDTIRYDHYAELNQRWAKKIKFLNLSIIKTEPKSLTALELMNAYFKEFSNEEVLSFINGIPKNLKNHPFIKNIYYNKFQKEIDFQKIHKFYDLTLFDTLENVIDFKEYYGNLVLIDFWASWCKPCIANIPAIKKIYEKYKDRDFKILSVSLDGSLKNWKKGISHSPVEWNNVSDLKAWDGFAVKYFKIESIPRYLLINADGSVLNDNVNLEDLDELITKNLND